MSHPDDPRSVCSRTREVMSLLNGASEPIGGDLRDHVSQCDICSEFETRARGVVDRLVADPAPRLSRDLVPGILHAVRASSVPQSLTTAPTPNSRWFSADRRAVAGALAGAVLLLGVGMRPARESTRPFATPAAAPRPVDPSDVFEARRRGVAWLLRQQAPDGSFTESPGSPATLTMTSEAVVAIAAAGDESPDVRRALDRALGWILRHQLPTGRFVDAPGRDAAAVHDAATLALLAVYQREPWPTLRPHCEQAIRAALSSAGPSQRPVVRDLDLALVGASSKGKLAHEGPSLRGQARATSSQIEGSEAVRNVLAAQRVGGRHHGSWSDIEIGGSGHRVAITASRLLELARIDGTAPKTS